MNFFKKIFGGGKGESNLPGANGWSARMGWRYVTYIEDGKMLVLSIEPMFIGPDTVYVPDSQQWRQSAPSWAGDRADEILSRLKSIAWNRELTWSGTPFAAFLPNDEPIPGSLESTSGGRRLEAERFFHPGNALTHAQAHDIWHVACRRFAAAARGRVTLFASGVIPKSVFDAVEFPALRANPNVTLDFK